jgi:SAM-dependent methyltransferase
VKQVLKNVAWKLGFRPSYGNYGVEREAHLGGYWRGGDPHSWCPELWDAAIERYGIKSVVDVGCGEGHSTKYFHDRGLRVLGVEGGEEAIRNNRVPHLVVKHDYTKGPYVPDAPYDLVWCCEFVEHVEERFVDNFLATFAAARYCLMTHGLPGQDGYHHVNLQPSEYWIQRLASVGFQHNAADTESLRATTAAKHVSRTLLFFQK